MEHTKTIVTVLAIAIVGGLGWYLFMDKATDEDGSDTSTKEMMGGDLMQENAMMDSTTMHTVNEFAVSANNFEYSVKEIRVKKGDTVKITLNNAEGFHDLVIDEFNAKTEKVNAGGVTSTTFTADKAGTFEYYCSVGTHRQMGMVGKLVVE